MPTAGVGISRGNYLANNRLGVSILLCPQRALEYFTAWTVYYNIFGFNPFMPTAGVGIWFLWYRRRRLRFCFNPFMPTAGVGIITNRIHTGYCIMVSILLCPQRALEWLLFGVVIIFNLCFNPFMPTAGVGIVNVFDESLRPKTEFQSFYAHSGRWNSMLHYWFGQLNYSFNPFMPTAGVGIFIIKYFLNLFFVFQSFYAHSGRWN